MTVATALETDACAAGPTLTGQARAQLCSRLEAVYDLRHSRAREQSVDELRALRAVYSDPVLKERLEYATDAVAANNNFMALDRLIDDLRAEAPTTAAPAPAGHPAAPSLSAEEIEALYTRLNAAFLNTGVDRLGVMAVVVRDLIDVPTDNVLQHRLNAVLHNLTESRSTEFLARLLADLAKPTPAEAAA